MLLCNYRNIEPRYRGIWKEGRTIAEEKNEPGTKGFRTYIRDDQYEKLREVSFETRTSIAEHVRKALDCYFASLEKETKK